MLGIFYADVNDKDSDALSSEQEMALIALAEQWQAAPAAFFETIFSDNSSITEEEVASDEIPGSGATDR